MTDHVQVVDDNIGKILKGRVKTKLAIDYEGRPDEYVFVFVVTLLENTC